MRLTECAPIRVLIADDEPLARTGIRMLLDSDPAVEIVAETGSGQQTLAGILRLRPDIVFLDVQMPGLNGFEVLAAVPVDELPHVIFVTAYENYALQAFEVNAVDYLLKPFEDERFADALARAKQKLTASRASGIGERLHSLAGSYDTARSGVPAPPEPASGGASERLSIRSAGRVVFLDISEIDWIEAADYYVQIHVGSDSHLLRRSMAKLEADLDPTKFLRVHRSAIVNVRRIKEVRRGEGRSLQVVLRDGIELTVSRRHRKKIQELIKEG